jgi:hypothetical protein
MNRVGAAADHSGERPGTRISAMTYGFPPSGFSVSAFSQVRRSEV